MLLRNIFDFFHLFANSLVIHHYPHSQIKKQMKKRKPEKMNTKRINYLVKMISPPGHKIMFLTHAFQYLAQGQGLTSSVCVVL